MAKDKRGHGSEKCEPGCTCGHHSVRRCPPGCTCGKHKVRNAGQFKSGDSRAGRSCPPGCECGRHIDKSGHTHSVEIREAIGAASASRERTPFTAEQRGRISAATKEAMQRPEVRERVRAGLAVAVRRPEYREVRARVAAKLIATGTFSTVSKPQLALRDLLESIGHRTELEVLFDRAVVDIYLPDLHLAVEADGVYWHSRREQENPGYYRRRDHFLLSRFDLPTLRFTDQEIERLTGAELREAVDRAQTERSR